MLIFKGWGKNEVKYKKINLSYTHIETERKDDGKLGREVYKKRSSEHEIQILRERNDNINRVRE